MNKIEKFNIKVGTSIISKFERIDIEMFRILSEFIDNSLQSYIDHEDDLKKYNRKMCKVDITWTNDELIIKDNCFGMDDNDFGRAIRLNAPSSSYSKNSLGKYGMGLKYAACNVGAICDIETTRLGSLLKYKTRINFDDWKLNDPETQDVLIDNCEITSSYTIIKISKVNIQFSTKIMEDTISKLSKIYKKFIFDRRVLELTINRNKVEYVEPELYLNEDGTEVYYNISSSFMFQNKVYKYSGWIGRLQTASTSNAGFTMIYNQRGMILNYRPKEIFKNSNGFEYQRIVGEIELDGEEWPLRINKDGFAWASTGLQNQFLADLASLSYIKKLQKEVKNARVRVDTEKIPNVTTTNCSVKGIQKSYKTDDIVAFTVIPEDGYKIKYIKVNNEILASTSPNNLEYSFKVLSTHSKKIDILCVCCPDSKPISIKPDLPVIIEVNPTKINNNPKKTEKEILESYFKELKQIKIPGIEAKEFNLNKDGIIINLGNISYSFVINKISSNDGNSWCDFKELPHPLENSYQIILNNSKGPFRYLNLGEDGDILLSLFSISLVLSRLISIYSNLSLDQSNVLIEKFNDILGKLVLNNEK